MGDVANQGSNRARAIDLPVERLLLARGAGVHSREANCQEMCELLPEQAVQGLVLGRLTWLQSDCRQRARRRQSVGVSPVSFRNAAAKAVCEE